ncbi:MAG: hypothetical protein JXX28_16635 [Deltaproteobacteria bacterium]|nr:hypothetical protein [Deltaproteobacteria bacterium]
MTLLFASANAWAASCEGTTGRVEGFISLKTDPVRFANGLGMPRVQKMQHLSANEEDAATLLLGFMPLLHLTPDDELLAQHGLTIEELAAVIPRAAKVVNGEIHVTFEDREELSEPQPLIDHLGQLTLETGTGERLLLSDLTDAWVGERQETHRVLRDREVAPVTPPPKVPRPEIREAPRARGDLMLVNPAGLRARVTVEGTELGVLGGLCTGVIRDVKEGSYQVMLRYPDGYKRTLEVETTTSSPCGAPDPTPQVAD